MIEKININEMMEFGEQMTHKTLVDTPSVLIKLISLAPQQEVPQHNANSSVKLLVLQGEVAVSLNEETENLAVNEMAEVQISTPMQISNKSEENAAFLVIKTPNPSQMT